MQLVCKSGEIAMILEHNCNDFRQEEHKHCPTKALHSSYTLISRNGSLE